MSSRPPRRVALTGPSGLIAGAVSAALRERGDHVVHLVRREPAPDLPAGVTEVTWDPGGRLDPAALEGVDAVLHLAGAGLGDRRWTSSYKATLRASRVEATNQLSDTLAELNPVPRLVSGSAVGYYGDRGADVLTEESSDGTGFLAELCRDWEAATWRLREAGGSVAHSRTGIVLAPQGGALGRLIPLAKLGLIGPLGSGKQYWSWISLSDAVRALLFLLDRPDLRGPVNLTSPSPVPQVELAEALSGQLGRPAVVPAPTIALRLALGEIAREMLAASQRVVPAVLADAGFRWEHSDLDDAIDWLLSERTAEAAR